MRNSLIPLQVSRTFTFGEKGVSIGQFFHKYLDKITLNQQAVDWRNEPLDYLIQRNYDEELRRQVAQGSIRPVCAAS